MIDLLRCLLGYWPRSHPAPQTIVARAAIAKATGHANP